MTIKIICDRCGEERILEHKQAVVDEFMLTFEDNARDMCMNCEALWTIYMTDVNTQIRKDRAAKIDEFFNQM